MQAILGLVATGLGVSLIPASARHLRERGVVYRELQVSTVQVEMVLAWRKEDISPALQAFISVAKEMI